tara:strand:+ start:53 stop:703 length:651 start_codon:yes stop_codon:yes gene_type:complete
MPMYEVYASKWDNPRYREAIDRNIKLNAIKGKKKRFLEIDINKKAFSIITKMLENYRLDNPSKEIEKDLFINKFYYKCAIDMDSNLNKYGQLSEKQINFILSFPSKMKENLDKHIKNNEEKLKSCFVGTVNERQDLNLTILNVTENEMQVSYYNYVTTYKHSMIDANKNLFVLWSSKNLLELNDNKNDIKINAKIKAHNEYNNIKTTIIKLPKIIK